MIFIILFLHYLAILHADALSISVPDVSVHVDFVNISPSCRDLASCWELSSIIRSCLTTIFACIWFAQHPDVPPPGLHWMKKLGRAVFDTIYILLLPDMMLVKAINQFISAGAVAKKLNVVRDKIKQEEKATQAGERDGESEEGYGEGEEGYGDSEEGDTSILDFARQRYDRKNPQAPPENRRKYTRRDGFFVVMSGLHFYNKDNTPMRPLAIKDVTDLAERGIFLIPPPDDIDDRSKASWITKGLALIQTVSFATQCVARLALRLPTTELEFTALAYTMVTVLAYLIWWMKPVSIGSPVRVVFVRPTRSGERALVSEGPSWDNFRKNFEGWRLFLFTTKRSAADISSRSLSIAVTVALSSAFGAIHCIYWWTSLAYWHNQDPRYNYSAFAITALPVCIGLCTMLETFIPVWNSQDDIVTRVLEWLLLAATIPLVIIYRLFRFALFFFALTAFINPQDPGVYQVPVWSTHMPNI